MQNFASSLQRQQIAHMRCAVLRTHKRPVADDHRQRRIELASNRHGEIVAAPGYERDFDTSPRSFGDRQAICLRQFPAAVEQRAVDVERYEAYRHGFSQS